MVRTCLHNLHTSTYPFHPTELLTDYTHSCLRPFYNRLLLNIRHRQPEEDK